MTDFKEGDKVRVVIEGRLNESGYVENEGILISPSQRKHVKSIELIERAGRPLEVGETIEHCGSLWRIEVIGRSELCISNATGLAITRPDMIKRPCGTPITEAKS